MSGKHRKKDNKNVSRSFAMVMQFGINMLVPICLMSAFGIWLDTKYDTSYWTVLLFFIGAVSGGQNVYRMARRIYEPSAPSVMEKDEKRPDVGERKKS